MGGGGMLEAIRWQMGPPASLKLLDQRLLPTQSVYIEIDGPEAAFTAIKVRLYELHCLSCEPNACLGARKFSDHLGFSMQFHAAARHPESERAHHAIENLFIVPCTLCVQWQDKDSIPILAGYGRQRSSSHCHLGSSWPCC